MKRTKTEEIALRLVESGYLRQSLERHSWGEGRVSHSMVVDKLMDWIKQGIPEKI